ncbi:hypothetical protein ACWHA1_40860 [Streptomyces decoyicus]
MSASGGAAVPGYGTKAAEGPAFVGEFEVHLTVRDDGDRGAAGALAAYAAARRLTCVHILLEQGDVPSQPMLTLHGSGTYEKVRAEAAAQADGLRAAGVITRELSGRDACTLRDAAAVVAEFRRDHPVVGRWTWLLADPDEAVRELSGSEAGTED